MIKIIKSDKLARPIDVGPGDTFKLCVDGVVVHSADITQIRIVTHWAYFQIGDGGLAYAIGDENLERDLKSCS